MTGNNQNLLQCSEKYGLIESEILELFITDSKCKKKLFVDEGVYTKNRHFRILGSSKQTKKVPLVISEENEYCPKYSEDSYNCCLFLDSLVTYFSWEVNKVLSFSETNDTKKSKSKTVSNLNIDSDPNLYPQITSFISSLISPAGKIRRKVYFSDSSLIVYDIQGFRYCENIQREHKSNNIKYVVDLRSSGYYQKCFDPDCETFRSNMKPLPDFIRFLLEDDNMLVKGSQIHSFTDFSDDNFVKIIENIESEYKFKDDLLDEDLKKIVDTTEDILEMSW